MVHKFAYCRQLIAQLDGDGHDLNAIGRGNIVLKMNTTPLPAPFMVFFWFPTWPTTCSALLLSLREEVTIFMQVGREVRDKLITSGYKEGNLYYLDQGGGGATHRACLSRSSQGTVCGITVLATWG